MDFSFNVGGINVSFPTLQIYQCIAYVHYTVCYTGHQWSEFVITTVVGFILFLIIGQLVKKSAALVIVTMVQ